MRALTQLLSTRLLIWLLALLGLAQAQSTVGVDPVARLFSAKPGESVTQVLNVYNPNATSQKLRISAYLTDLDISEIGESSYPPVGSLLESLGAWITFSPSEFELGGQETKQVRYTIQVPANAAPGTHWAMLMLEGQDPNPTPGKTLTSFRLRVSHTMYMNVLPTVQGGSIVGIFEGQPKQETDIYQLGVQYVNTGNAVSGVRGRVELRNEQGTLAATLELPLTVALPGRTVLLKAGWAGPVPKGQYSALVILNNGQPNTDIAGEHVVSLPFDLVQRASAPTTPGNQTPASQPTTPTPAPGGSP